MRSIFGRARVTQSVAPSGPRGGMRASGTSGKPAARQAAWPPSSVSARAPALRSQAATPSLRAWPSAQITTAARPARAGAQAATSSAARRRAPGTRRGSAAASSSLRTSISAGVSGRPSRRKSLSGARLLGEGIGCVLAKTMMAGRDALAGASWGDRGPHARGCPAGAGLSSRRRPGGDCSTAREAWQPARAERPSPRRAADRTRGRRQRGRSAGRALMSHLRAASWACRVPWRNSACFPTHPRELRFWYPEELQIEALPHPQSAVVAERPARHPRRRPARRDDLAAGYPAAVGRRSTRWNGDPGRSSNRRPTA